MWHCTSGVQGLPGIPEDEEQGKDGRETAWSAHNRWVIYSCTCTCESTHTNKLQQSVHTMDYICIYMYATDTFT